MLTKLNYKSIHHKISEDIKKFDIIYLLIQYKNIQEIQKNIQ